MDDKERESLEREIDRHYRWFDTGSRFWSTAHHSSLYLAAILSAAAALTLKLDSLKTVVVQSDLAAVLSTIAALLGTLAASGGFQRKWKSNRRNRGELDQIRLDLSDSAADAKALRDKLKDIIARHDKEITGQE